MEYDRLIQNTVVYKRKETVYYSIIVSQYGCVCGGKFKDIVNSDVPTPAWPESPGFRQLGLGKITGQAKSQMQGLALAQARALQYN